MLYFDTSFLTPLFRPEATSRQVQPFVAGLATASLAVSHLVRIEFSSLLAREVRMRSLAEPDAAALDRAFEDTLRRSFAVLTPAPADFDLARQFLNDYATGLRAGDALHLAIARNRDARAIYSLDKAFLKAGRHLGLPVSPGIALEGYDPP